MSIWYCADTHFSHANILKYCSRPFSSYYEMDEALIANWNEEVAPQDVVWHLGDFAFGKDSTFGRMKTIFDRLNGHKHLIMGNHDRRNLMDRLGWESIQDVKLVRDGQQDLWLSHYKHSVWPKSHRGCLHLFGHSHGTSPNTSKSMDVGVDPCGYRPVNLEYILETMGDSEPHESKDHHK